MLLREVRSALQPAIQSVTTRPLTGDGEKLEVLDAASSQASKSENLAGPASKLLSMGEPGRPAERLRSPIRRAKIGFGKRGRQVIGWQRT